MPYSCDIANVLAGQLERFVTLNRHQLAGHVPNLDFWLAEVRHCLEVIDGYGPRFERLKAGQSKHVRKHGTIEFSLSDPCCTHRPAAPPNRVPDTELNAARRSLCDATYHFLVRCLHEGLIDEATLRRGCDRFDIGVEPSDLEKSDRR